MKFKPPGATSAFTACRSRSRELHKRDYLTEGGLRKKRGKKKRGKKRHNHAKYAHLARDWDLAATWARAHSHTKVKQVIGRLGYPHVVSARSSILHTLISSNETIGYVQINNFLKREGWQEVTRHANPLLDRPNFMHSGSLFFLLQVNDEGQNTSSPISMNSYNKTHRSNFGEMQMFWRSDLSAVAS